MGSRDVVDEVWTCRQAQRDQEIGGYHIRKDQWVGCAVYALHRDPKYWQVCLLPYAADPCNAKSAQQYAFYVHMDYDAWVGCSAACCPVLHCS